MSQPPPAQALSTRGPSRVYGGRDQGTRIERCRGANLRAPGTIADLLKRTSPEVLRVWRLSGRAGDRTRVRCTQVVPRTALAISLHGPAQLRDQGDGARVGPDGTDPTPVPCPDLRPSGKRSVLDAPRRDFDQGALEPESVGAGRRGGLRDSPDAECVATIVGRVPLDPAAPRPRRRRAPRMSVRSSSRSASGFVHMGLASDPASSRSRGTWVSRSSRSGRTPIRVGATG